MSSRLLPVENLAADASIGKLVLRWEHEPYDPLVDHYAIYADRAAEVGLDPEYLLAKTVFPRFAHRIFGGRGEDWSYRIVAVDASGRRSQPSRTVRKSFVESVAISGEPVAVIGTFDHKSFELALSPNGYARYTTEFPDGPHFVHGVDDPVTDWPYIHPGPADRWAGSRDWRAVFDFDLDLTTVGDRQVWLSIWLIDTHATIPGTATLALNGSDVTLLEFEGGGTRGSLEGDATRPGTPLIPSYVELPLPSDLLVDGRNSISLHKADGSWHAYDALGVFLVG